MILSDVRYAPDLCVNLLSDGLFDDQGVNMKRENGVMTYSFKGKGVFTANKSRRGLWPINAEVIRPPDAMTVSQTPEDYQIEWHRRMGHIGFKSLHQLASADVVHGNVVSGANKFECSTCSACKITRRPFPASKKPKERHPLDKIHVDLLEMKRASRNGHQYALVITDDHSKAKFAFPLKKKSDAVIDFKKWMVYAERMADRKLKCIRTDNAKELTEGGMKALIDDLGIETQESLPYEHEQNGMAERANRTLEEKVRCMLMDAGLENKYWADALRTAAFLSNRSPVKNEKLTPIELFSGIKPDLSGVRIFGSICYAKRPVKDTAGQNKFEPRGERCRMVGYAQGGHSYVLIREEDGTEITRTHVIFHECEPSQTSTGKKTKKASKSEPTSTAAAKERVQQPSPQMRMPSAKEQRPSTVKQPPKKSFQWTVDSDSSSDHDSISEVESSAVASENGENRDEDSENEIVFEEEERQDTDDEDEDEEVSEDTETDNDEAQDDSEDDSDDAGDDNDQDETTESSSDHRDSGDDYNEPESEYEGQTPPRAPRRSSRPKQQRKPGPLHQGEWRNR
jgi:hypothetical protein